MGCYIWYSEDGSGRVAASPSPLLAVYQSPSPRCIPTITAHPSTARCTNHSPLLYGFNVAQWRNYKFCLPPAKAAKHGHRPPPSDRTIEVNCAASISTTCHEKNWGLAQGLPDHREPPALQGLQGQLLRRLAVRLSGNTLA